MIDINNIPEHELLSAIDMLSDKEAHALLHDPEIWLRDKQRINDEWPESILLFCWGRGGGKLLSCNEKILTSAGWKTIGTIDVGDRVYDEMGRLCNVLAYYEPPPERVYELVFDTGEKVVVDGCHLFTTWTQKDRDAYGCSPYMEDWYLWKVFTGDSADGPTTKTTQEIVDTFCAKHSIPVCFPFQNEHIKSKHSLLCSSGKKAFLDGKVTNDRERFIVDYREIPPPAEGMRCLTVDSPSNLFLVTESFIPTHNTYLGSQWIRKKVREGFNGVGAIITPTSNDYRNTIWHGALEQLVDQTVEGGAFEPSKSRVVFNNGAVFNCYSAERADRLRGGNNALIWIDELCAINDPDVFIQASLTLRVGESRMLITTTPKPNETIRDLYSRAVFNDDPPKEGKDVRVITGSTYDNIHNLSPAFRNQILKSYKGTRLERQEIFGELLLDNEGALWTTDMLIKQTLKEGMSVPPLDRVAIGVDPSVTNTKRSDNTGIVVAGLSGEEAFVLQDVTGKYSADEWSRKVLALYDYYSQQCTCSIVVERNQGGNLLAQTLQRNRPLLPVDYVFSTNNKISRAEPVSMLYEQGKIWHVRGLTELEQEMTSFDGDRKRKSPDRLDALVFAITQLMPAKQRVTKGFEFVV